MLAQALHLQPLRIDMLALDEALALLANRLGRALSGDELGTDEEPGPAVELATRLGLHPLALEVAAAQLARGRHGWTCLLEPLRSRQGTSLAALELSADDRLASLQTCFDLSVDALSDGLANVYRHLGVLAPRCCPRAWMRNRISTRWPIMH